MSPRARACVACFVLATAASCASTRIARSWRDTGVGPFRFKKVLVVVVSTNELIRSSAEDEVVSQITRTNAVPSYKLFLASDLNEKERVKAKVTEEGFDGAVVMRLVDKTQQLTWSPGAYPADYYSFYGYWGRGWGAPYSPGTLRVDTILRIETNIYSVTQNRLLWSGLSETFNPNDHATLIKEVAGAVARELRKEGLIQQEPGKTG